MKGGLGRVFNPSLQSTNIWSIIGKRVHKCVKRGPALSSPPFQSTAFGECGRNLGSLYPLVAQRTSLQSKTMELALYANIIWRALEYHPKGRCNNSTGFQFKQLHSGFKLRTISPKRRVATHCKNDRVRWFVTIRYTYSLCRVPNHRIKIDRIDCSKFNLLQYMLKLYTI